MRAMNVETRSEMRTLHEEIIDRLKLLAEAHPARSSARAGKRSRRS
jgi:hypothetical protein